MRANHIIDDRLDAFAPDGQTALWDSVLLALNELWRGHNRRRSIVVISGGGDNHSMYTESELKQVIEEADIQLYAIGMFDRFPRRNEERRGPRDLDELTTVSGGRLLPIHDAAELSYAIRQVNEELRNQYVLGYSSTN